MEIIIDCERVEIDHSMNSKRRIRVTLNDPDPSDFCIAEIYDLVDEEGYLEHRQTLNKEPKKLILVEPELLATAYCYLEQLMVTTPYPADLVEFMEQLSNLILKEKEQ